MNLFTDLPESQPSALELARRRFEAAQEKASELGTSTIHDQASGQAWDDAQEELRAAKLEVFRLEHQAMYRPTTPSES